MPRMPPASPTPIIYVAPPFPPMAHPYNGSSSSISSGESAFVTGIAVGLSLLLFAVLCWGYLEWYTLRPIRSRSRYAEPGPSYRTKAPARIVLPRDRRCSRIASRDKILTAKSKHGTGVKTWRVNSPLTPTFSRLTARARSSPPASDASKKPTGAPTRASVSLETTPTAAPAPAAGSMKPFREQTALQALLAFTPHSRPGSLPPIPANGLALAALPAAAAPAVVAPAASSAPDNAPRLNLALPAAGAHSPQVPLPTATSSNAAESGCSALSPRRTVNGARLPSVRQLQSARIAPMDETGFEEDGSVEYSIPPRRRDTTSQRRSPWSACSTLKYEYDPDE